MEADTRLLPPALALTSPDFPCSWGQGLAGSVLGSRRASASGVTPHICPGDRALQACPARQGSATPCRLQPRCRARTVRGQPGSEALSPRGRPGQHCPLHAPAQRSRDTGCWCRPHLGRGPKRHLGQQETPPPRGAGGLQGQRAPQLNVGRKLLTQTFLFPSGSSLTLPASESDACARDSWGQRVSGHSALARPGWASGHVHPPIRVRCWDQRESAYVAMGLHLEICTVTRSHRH